MKIRHISAFCIAALFLGGCNEESSEDIPITSHIQSLEFDYKDNSDLEPIHQAVAGKAFIGLGEATHGGSNGFKAKSRITKYLHQTGDVDVLAMESGLYDGLRLWQRLQDGEISDVRDAMLFSFMFMYAETPEIYPLYRYVEQQAFTERPLILAAFDGRHSSDPACSIMLPEMQTFVEKHQLVNLDWPQFITNGQAMMCPWYFAEPNNTEKQSFITQLSELNLALTQMKAEQILPEIEQREDFREYATFWLQVVKSMQAHLQGHWFDRFNPDEIMQADNLQWLHTEWFPNKNILAWGHNVHISAYVGAWPDSIGAFAHLKQKTDPNKVYSLIHAAAEGYFTPLKAELSERYQPSLYLQDENSVEQQLAKEGVNQAFIKIEDIANLPGNKTIIDQPVNYSQTLADGIIYTRYETPSSIDSPR